MVGVPCDHGDTLPSSKLLDRVEINPRLSQSGCKSVAQVMESQVFNLSLLRRRIEPSEKIPGAYPGCILGMKNTIGFSRVRFFPTLQNMSANLYETISNREVFIEYPAIPTTKRDNALHL